LVGKSALGEFGLEQGANVGTATELPVPVHPSRYRSRPDTCLSFGATGLKRRWGGKHALQRGTVKDGNNATRETGAEDSRDKNVSHNSFCLAFFVEKEGSLPHPDMFR